MSFCSFYEEALKCFSNVTSSNNLLGAFEQITGSSNTRLSAKIAVREIRCLLSLKEKLDDSARDRLLDLCSKVIENSVADKTDRAWSLYYSAHHIIGLLRRSGSLQRLWNGEETTVPDEDRKGLERARALLTVAVNLHVIGSDILSRTLLRSLALVAGPERGTLTNSSAGALVLLSIGQSYRQQMIRSLTQSESEPSDSAKQLLDIFDLFGGSGIDGDGITQLLDQLALVSPDDWKFVAVTLSPSGDVLMTSVERDSESGAMRMKTTRVEARDSQSAYDDIMIPLDGIVEASQKQLHGMDVAAVSERFSKEEAKRKWWDSRHRLDEDLQVLLEHVESNYFPSLPTSINSGQSIFQSAGDSANLPIGNLASRFDAAVEVEPVDEETDESLRMLTVPKLKERLRDKFGFSDSRFRKMKKQDLIDLYLEESKPMMCSAVARAAPGGCLFLLLDENLHRFPFEGMPSLLGNSVCRVPSLSFVLASLLDRNGNEPNQTLAVDPTMVSFVLDPERNLISTRNRIRPILDGLAMDHNCDWSAVVGEIPSASFFEDGLCRENGLFMFFGHGGAQTCFSRKQVENLIGGRDGHDARACRSTVILMGCSSGRLVSVNRKHSHSIDQIPLYYEPEGIALSYLWAGAPCVVGNLWDVTDRDIDRYSATLMESFLAKDNDGASLASCVARARSTCKLPYIVGCAPVCYGVPVHLIKNTKY
jgi:separase